MVISIRYLLSHHFCSSIRPSQIQVWWENNAIISTQNRTGYLLLLTTNIQQPLLNVIEDIRPSTHYSFTLTDIVCSADVRPSGNPQKCVLIHSSRNFRSFLSNFCYVLNTFLTHSTVSIDFVWWIGGFPFASVLLFSLPWAPMLLLAWLENSCLPILIDVEKWSLSIPPYTRGITRM